MKRVLLIALSSTLGVCIACKAVAESGNENWDPAFGVPGTDGPVWAMISRGDEVFAAGRFSQIGGASATNIAKWDRVKWSPLGGGLSSPDFPTVFALAAVNRGVYAGGVFSTAGGLAITNIAFWDGTHWFPLGAGVNNIVRSLATDGTNLYAGGTFTRAGEVSVNNIARWDGTNWSALGAGIPGEAVDSLAIGGGYIYAGGRFTSAGGVSAANIARWDGSNWFPLGQGLRPYVGDGGGDVIVRALASRGEELFAGGAFGFAGDVATTNIAKWDGMNWSAIGGVFSGGIYSLVQGGNLLFAGGYFGSVGSVQANDVAQWNGQIWSSLGAGLGDRNRSAGVFSMACNGSELFVGGFEISTGGSKPSTNIALWHIPHSLSAERTGNQVRLCWPATGSNYVLESCTQLPNTNWAEVQRPPTTIGDQLVVTNDVIDASRFFRLRRR